MCGYTINVIVWSIYPRIDTLRADCPIVLPITPTVLLSVCVLCPFVFAGGWRRAGGKRFWPLLLFATFEFIPLFLYDTVISLFTHFDIPLL